ncbi:MAG: sugar phosphate isomerase/epimerase [Abditibacteriota bacterium]|nr:sugar phosphate isomerase/epimerase [Abditibacteriota bacterium]
MKKFNVGTCVYLREDPEESFKATKDMGINSIQLLSWEPKIQTDEVAAKVNAAKEKYDMEISAFWCGWTGPCIWNFYEGQATLGLVPPVFRDHRLNELIHGSEFAEKIRVNNIVTHVGFMPENPFEQNYRDLITVLRHYCELLKSKGQRFLFETGQETPVTLLRAIEDIGTGNVGVNLDTANLILYGKANPVDAVRVLGKYVWQMHCKDGVYPTDGKNLGLEKKIGEGLVDFPKIISMLRELDYPGTLTIEREIAPGAEQTKDILEAKEYLESL